MKKIVIAALLSTFVATPAVAADFYAGVRQGSVNYGYSFVTNNDQAGFGLLGGYIINDNFAMEIEFMDLGGFDVARRFVNTQTGDQAIIRSTYTGNALSLSVVSTYQLTEAISLSGKFGIANTTLDTTPYATISTTINGQPVESVVRGKTVSYSKDSLTAGLRGQYNMTPSVGIYLAVDSFAVDATDVGVGQSTTSLATVSSVGAMFKF